MTSDFVSFAEGGNGITAYSHCVGSGLQWEEENNVFPGCREAERLKPEGESSFAQRPLLSGLFRTSK